MNQKGEEPNSNFSFYFYRSCLSSFVLNGPFVSFTELFRRSIHQVNRSQRVVLKGTRIYIALPVPLLVERAQHLEPLTQGDSCTSIALLGRRPVVLAGSPSPKGSVTTVSPLCLLHQSVVTLPESLCHELLLILAALVLLYDEFIPRRGMFFSFSYYRNLQKRFGKVGLNCDSSLYKYLSSRWF